MSRDQFQADGQVVLIDGESVLWIADLEASAVTSFPAADWVVSLAIEDGPGTFKIEVGTWHPDCGAGVFTPASNGTVQVNYLGATVRDNPFTIQCGAFDFPAADRIAVSVTAVVGKILLHAGSAPDDCGTSWIEISGYEPPPLVPQLSTVLLLGAGLAGVSGLPGLGSV